MKNNDRLTLGRIESVDLPEWEFQNIEAKIDTGAYTSSLHCHHIEKFTKGGQHWIQFNVLDPEHENYNEQLIQKKLFDTREVKSSNGQVELRHFIKTPIILFNRTYDIELSLTDRSSMKYPLLIGRKFIKKGNFLVDVNKKFLSSAK